MRMIKFRVWKTDKTTGVKQLIGHERLNEKGVWQRSAIECGIWVNGVFGKGFREQFTGLLDKDGKEIYEGDVCEVNYRGAIVATGVVVFEYERFAVAYNSRIYPLTNGDLAPFLPIILDNIHDNPELLKPE